MSEYWDEPTFEESQLNYPQSNQDSKVSQSNQKPTLEEGEWDETASFRPTPTTFDWSKFSPTTSNVASSSQQEENWNEETPQYQQSRQYSKPYTPRDYNHQSKRGNYRPRYDNTEIKENYSNTQRQGEYQGGYQGGRGGYRGGYRGGKDDMNQQQDFRRQKEYVNMETDFSGNPERVRPPLYTPQGPSDELGDVFSKNISEGIDFHKYKNIKVQISGGDDKQDSIHCFDASSGISSGVLSNVVNCGYTMPTPIQKFTIPIVLKGSHDIMGCAQTGSGKTAAFLIPTFSQIIAQDYPLTESSIVAPYLIVIAPTRELTNQIFLEMRKFAYNTGIRTGVVYGGVSMQYIMKYLRNGCDAISATPGRLKALINQGNVSLKNLRYLVLDEADRMLDMGFIGEIRQIIFSYDMPDHRSRRTYMFSATFPADIQKLAREILAPNYYFITIGIVGGAADSIKQDIFSVAPHEKRDRLMELLTSAIGTKILVFVETKHGADFLTTFLCQKGIQATSIHGDRFQEQREEALKTFTRGLTPVLVATSVAARGLDIADVDMVVNFDLPSSIDEYVHRIGRTGRLGNLGSAVSFFCAGKDDSLAAPLVTILKNATQEIPEFLAHYDYASSGTRNFVNSRDDRNIERRSFRDQMHSNDRGSGNALPSVSTANPDEEWD